MNNTEIIVALIGLCTALIIAFIPWVKSKIDYKKYIKFISGIMGDKTLECKKELVSSWLKSKGVFFDDSIIDAIVKSINKIIDEVGSKSE